MNLIKKTALVTVLSAAIVGSNKTARNWCWDQCREHCTPFTNYRRDINNMARGLGVESAKERDAFMHAYTSAKLYLKVGEGFTNFLGKLNETARPDNPPQDKFMDLYNNKKGIKIGKIMESKGLPIDSLPRIVLDSLKRGSFVTKYKNHLKK
jgi:hypothetical protein